MKNIAVITGASSGMGKRFAETLEEYGKSFDEVWVMARRLERLQELDIKYPKREISLDLSDPASFEIYKGMLEQEEVNIRLLINCSGYGKFRATAEVPLGENLGMIDLNCRALTAMCLISLPYMSEGGKIINIASVAAFQPIPYINIYAASKAYVLSFSRALNRELRGRGIGVTAVCPFWTATEFFGRAIDEGEPKVVKKYTAMYYPEQIVKRAWRDAKKGKDVSKFGFVARFQAGLAKILPHSFVMSFWMDQQKLK